MTTALDSAPVSEVMTHPAPDRRFLHPSIRIALASDPGENGLGESGLTVGIRRAECTARRSPPELPVRIELPGGLEGETLGLTIDRGPGLDTFTQGTENGAQIDLTAAEIRRVAVMMGVLVEHTPALQRLYAAMEGSESPDKEVA